VKVTTAQVADAIRTLESISADLAAVYALDAKLRSAARPDGYRRSVRPMEGSRPATDDDGETLPGHSDPTGATVVAIMDGRSSTVSREVDVLTGALSEVFALVAQADGARARALEPGREHTAPDGCRNHATHGLGWEPVLVKERCRWCYEFWTVQGVDAPAVLLAKRARGGRIYDADIDRALAHRRSKRARARRRRAG